MVLFFGGDCCVVGGYDFVGVFVDVCDGKVGFVKCGFNVEIGCFGFELVGEIVWFCVIDCIGFGFCG